MTNPAWTREDQADLAVSRIFEAASQAFVELGVSQTKMGDIARYAGCSRGTLYNYFKSRRELHVAYVSNSADRIAERVQAKLDGLEEPREKFVEAVLCSVREVRADPVLSAWFQVGESGLAADLSLGSAGLDAIAEKFAAELLGRSSGEKNKGKGSARLLARWCVRIIVSLLTMPGENAREERALVEDYAAVGIFRKP
ncbi:MAG: TetR/AcrR family transcriptional regulator [Deltaproteobacteria bacterium]|nr:TetR/AcrR family transcriptional regulator [Deltaproteobacteria bacterium]